MRNDTISCQISLKLKCPSLTTKALTTCFNKTQLQRASWNRHDEGFVIASRGLQLHEGEMRNFEAQLPAPSELSSHFEVNFN